MRFLDSTFDISEPTAYLFLFCPLSDYSIVVLLLLLILVIGIGNRNVLRPNHIFTNKLNFCFLWMFAENFDFILLFSMLKKIAADVQKHGIRLS